MIKHGQVVITSLILSWDFNGIKHSGFALMIYCMGDTPRVPVVNGTHYLTNNARLCPDTGWVLKTGFPEKSARYHFQTTSWGRRHVPACSFLSILGCDSCFPFCHAQRLRVCQQWPSKAVPKPEDACSHDLSYCQPSTLSTISRERSSRSIHLRCPHLAGITFHFFRVTLFSRKETGRRVKAGAVALCNCVQRTLKTYASRKHAGI